MAVAGARVVMRQETLARIAAGDVAKGDVLAVARLAGIMAAKRTAELIPLCHPLALTSVAVELVCVARAFRGRDHRDLPARRPDRGRDGGADRGKCRGADGLRHVQGGRSRHDRHRFAAVEEIGRAVGQLGGRAVISVEEALSRVLALVERIAGRADLARRRARPRARRGSGLAAHAAALRGLGDGRLCRARRGSGADPGRVAHRRRGAGRGRVRRSCRAGRGGAHLHRRADARGHRHDRDPGGHRTRGRPGEGARGRSLRPLCPPRGARFRRGRRAAQGRPAADGARHRPRRGDEPAVALRPSPAADRDPVRPATRS